MNEHQKEIHNGESVLLDQIPVLNINEFRNEIIKDLNQENGRICSLFGQPDNEKAVRLFAVIAKPENSNLKIISSLVKDSYESLTPVCPQVHLFEREIAENFGILPEGHPWLKQVRYMNNSGAEKISENFTESGLKLQSQIFENNEIKVEDKGKGNKSNYSSLPQLSSKYNFFKVNGEQIHEVAVGPVHAGIIEPGHFRFQCEGEEILHLEIALGFQHRGIEKALIGGPDKRTIHIMETISGDTTIGHTLAYCQLYESLTEIKVPARAEYIRAIALELERLANHTGDLGALANDVGFLPTASYCGRLRGDFLNMTALICGSRFGRTLLKPGGVNYDIDKNMVNVLRKRLHDAYIEVKQAVELLWKTSSVMNRFNETGKVDKETCIDLGVVGFPARACGIERDVRYEFPSGIFKYLQIPVSTWPTGDVFGRTYVRWMEIERSVKFINELLENLPTGTIINEIKKMKPGSVTVSLTEGWRGEICHTAITGNDGKFLSYKIVDPSFHNWLAVAISCRNQQISDFPLCNKSFNLSYCGFDL